MPAVTIKKARKLAKRDAILEKIKSIPLIEKKIAELKAEKERQEPPQQVELPEGYMLSLEALKGFGLQFEILEQETLLLAARTLARKHVKPKAPPVPAGTMMRASNGSEYRILADGSRVREHPKSPRREEAPGQTVMGHGLTIEKRGKIKAYRFE